MVKLTHVEPERSSLEDLVKASTLIGLYVEQIRQLHDALLRHGCHLSWCRIEDGDRCTCGLQAALAIGQGDAWR